MLCSTSSGLHQHSQAGGDVGTSHPEPWHSRQSCGCQQKSMSQTQVRSIRKRNQGQERQNRESSDEEWWWKGEQGRCLKGGLGPPVLLSWEFYRQRSLAGYSPLSHKELDMTEQLTLSLFSCVCVCVCIYTHTIYILFHIVFHYDLSLDLNIVSCAV